MQQMQPKQDYRPKDIDIISRECTQFLRHSQDKEAIDIMNKNEGFVPTIVIASHLFSYKKLYGNKKYFPEEMCRLLVIPDKNDKARFEYKVDDEGKTYMRALQGHSNIMAHITCTDLKDATFDFVYHATTPDNWKKIEEDGYLRPMGRTAVHFASELNKTRKGKQNKYSVVLKLDVNKFQKDGNKLLIANNGVILSETPVELKYITTKFY